mgnify:CR=1 FL=1
MDATLQRFLRNATRDAEAAALRVRRVLIPLFALRLVAARFEEVLAFVPKHWLSLGCLIGGLVISEALSRRFRESDALRWSMASVLLDVAIAFGVCLWGVWWPIHTYAGLLARADWAVFPVLAIAGGLRLNRTVTGAGSAVATLALLALLGLDMAWNSAAIVYGPGDVLLAVVFMLAGALLGDAVAARILRLVQTGAQKAVQADRAKQRLGTYVSEEVAELALADDAALAGEERQVAVLFSDLRGFTTYSENARPDALVEELNAYLEAMVPAVLAEGGIVDKYIGDAIMAVFGAPFRDGDEAGRAIRAAAAMTAALETHNADRATKGLPPLAMGVGVHMGRVVAGHVGTKDRLQYTVVGDTVNVASRLEGATKTEGVPMLFSEAVVTSARSGVSTIPSLVVHGAIDIRGRTQRLTVYTLES